MRLSYQQRPAARLVQGIPGALAAGSFVFAPVALRFVRNVVAAPEEFRLDPEGFVLQFCEAWERVQIPGGDGCIALLLKWGVVVQLATRGGKSQRETPPEIQGEGGEAPFSPSGPGRGREHAC